MKISRKQKKQTLAVQDVGPGLIHALKMYIYKGDPMHVNCVLFSQRFPIHP